MRLIRRHDLSPRVEMLPLIDVVFLLLTFFIYSLALMVRADLLPVKLTTLHTSEPATPAPIESITIDHRGQLFYNRQPIDSRELDRRLLALANRDDQPTLYVAMQAHGSTDRGPVLIHLIERVRAAGVQDFVIVGQPPPPEAPPEAPPEGSSQFGSPEVRIDPSQAGP